jgi:hypothetical protein
MILCQFAGWKVGKVGSSMPQVYPFEMWIWFTPSWLGCGLHPATTRSDVDLPSILRPKYRRDQQPKEHQPDDRILGPFPRYIEPDNL